MGHDNTGCVHKKPEAICENVSQGKGFYVIQSVSLALHDVLLVLCGLADDLKGLKKKGMIRERVSGQDTDDSHYAHKCWENTKVLKKSDTP